ncbi:HTH domain-containing protein [Chloroflexia bacterium SDU3-3]|nr:HTH domain-containing protein [Chloroflexia bacterium SDU3-3]
MFGSKQAKQARLEREVEIIRAAYELTVAELAERIGVPRKTVYSDLVDLHDRGVILQEAEGKVSMYEPY